jgi:hypothetical protein
MIGARRSFLALLLTGTELEIEKPPGPEPEYLGTSSCTNAPVDTKMGVRDE